MKSSPFGGEVRRHTLFFKPMEEMAELRLEEGLEQGPDSNGGREVSQYQWVLVSDLLSLRAPALFGRVLGLYTPEALRVPDLRAELKKEFFSVPFFVLLQQTGVRTILSRFSRQGVLPKGGAGDTEPRETVVPEGRKTFSQIVFTRGGFKDWRLVHSGFLDHDFIPKHSGMTAEAGGASAVTHALEKRFERSHLLKAQAELDHVIAHDPEANQDSEDIRKVELKVLHRPEELLYPFSPNSPNFWSVDTSSIEDSATKHSIAQLMEAYVGLQKCLAQVRERSSGQMSLGREQKPSPLDHPLQTMTDAQLEHFFSDLPPVELTDTRTVLEAYQKKVKMLRDFTNQVDGITHPSFVTAVDAVLREERAHPRMFTVYHGCTGEIHFLNTVYGALAKILGFPERPVYWRLFDKVTQRYGNIEEAFTDTCQSSSQENEYLSPFEVMVSGNAALTGNPEHDGCRTLTYWLRSHSEVPLDLKHVLVDVFTSLGLKLETASSLAEELHGVFNTSYHVEDPKLKKSDPKAQGTPEARGLDLPSSSSEKRRLGVLRQIFVDPQDAHESIALSGWFFNHPLSFEDRHLPDGTIASLYDSLEDGETGWMKELPPVIRFMAHIRAGHSSVMEGAIRKYQELAPDGCRPFSLLDYEVRLLTSSNPACVKTHFYPSTPHDNSREALVEQKTVALAGEVLKGTEIGIRQFHEFRTQQGLLGLIFNNQLNLKVAPPPVSTSQFKSAVFQGDCEAMQVFLQGPERLRPFSAKDIVSGEQREFNVADYMMMTALSHKMSNRSVMTSIEKFGVWKNTDFTKTPFALRGLLNRYGLSGLKEIGWKGGLDCQLSLVVPRESEAEDLFGLAPVAAKEKVSMTLHNLTVGELLERQTDKDSRREIDRIRNKTNLAALPVSLWNELATTKEKVSAFLESRFVYFLSVPIWNAIVNGLAAGGIDKKTLYSQYHSMILKIFHLRKADGVTELTGECVTLILAELMKHNGKETVLTHLKDGKSMFYFMMCQEGGVPGNTTQCLPFEVYQVFKKLSLLEEPSWKSFERILFQIYEKERECFQDLLEIIKDGYPLSPELLFSYPFEILDEYLNRKDATVGSALVSLCEQEGIHAYKKYIPQSRFLPDQKKRLQCHLYRLTYLGDNLLKDYTQPKFAGEWFRDLEDTDRVQILTHPDFDGNTLLALNLPEIYTSEGEMEYLRKLLFPTLEKSSGFVFTFSEKTTVRRATSQWLNRFLNPYVHNAFDEFKRDLSKLSTYAFALFLESNLELPEDYAPEALRPIIQKFGFDSVLLLSSKQISSVVPQLSIISPYQVTSRNEVLKDLVPPRLEQVKEMVRETLLEECNNQRKITQWKVEKSVIERFISYGRDKMPEFIISFMTYIYSVEPIEIEEGVPSD